MLDQTPVPVAADITGLIGNTPLIDLTAYATARGGRARVLGKVEAFNPLFSVKDRIAAALIRQGEESGALKPGSLIVDVTGGNTGVALAGIAAARGYRTKFYQGDTTSPTKRRILEALGSEIIPTDNSIFLDPEGREKLVETIKAESPDSYFTDQLGNPVNRATHYETTGPEIWQDTHGEVDVLVGGVGTGGTVSGAGRFLKDRRADVKVVVAEPGETSLPTEEKLNPDAEIGGVHKVAGLEDEQLPPNYDLTIADEIVPVEAADAWATARAVFRGTGLFVGASAGASLTVAAELAARPEYEGATIVAVLPDAGKRYLSAGVFDDPDA
ncbi:PLP-dependent cysteine synthase family protein [Corynebacterium variabile]|uniref:PLP-dependent cysteine synthase family protein n=1 Tax=Corynebacterium variabile TaxID=1727 RepID=UPI002899C243|nr:cysteine synthase family protein [Corynebacterium variabile]